MTTKDFLRTSNAAAKLFLGMIHAAVNAPISDAERAERIGQIMDAYQPAKVSILHPALQLRRLRILRHALRRQQ